MQWLEKAAGKFNNSAGGLRRFLGGDPATSDEDLLVAHQTHTEISELIMPDGTIERNIVIDDCKVFLSQLRSRGYNQEQIADVARQLGVQEEG